MGFLCRAPSPAWLPSPPGPRLRPRSPQTEERPRPPLKLTCRGGAAGTTAHLRSGEGRGAPRPAQRPAERGRPASVQEAVPTRLMRPGRRSPRFSPPPEPRLLAKAVPATPTCRFPTTQPGKNGKPKEISPAMPRSFLRGPSHLGKVCLKTKAATPVSPAPSFPGRDPYPPRRHRRHYSVTPYPTGDQESPAAVDLANHRALVRALAEVLLPRQEAVSPPASGGEPRPPLILAPLAHKGVTKARPLQADAHPASRAPG